VLLAVRLGLAVWDGDSDGEEFVGEGLGPSGGLFCRKLANSAAPIIAIKTIMTKRVLVVLFKTILLQLEKTERAYLSNIRWGIFCIEDSGKQFWLLHRWVCKF
jgi:hypothetical protein